MSISSFYIFVNQCEGNSLEKTKQELDKKLWPTMYTNWKVWPLLQLFNFTCVPVHLQVFYVNFMQVWWNVYLSYMKNCEGVVPAVEPVDLLKQGLEKGLAVIEDQKPDNVPAGVFSLFSGQPHESINILREPIFELMSETLKQ